MISRLALLSLSARILSRAAFPTLLFSDIKIIGKGEKGASRKKRIRERKGKGEGEGV